MKHLEHKSICWPNQLQRKVCECGVNNSESSESLRGECWCWPCYWKTWACVCVCVWFDLRCFSFSFPSQCSSQLVAQTCTELRAACWHLAEGKEGKHTAQRQLWNHTRCGEVCVCQCVRPGFSTPSASCSETCRSFISHRPPWASRSVSCCCLNLRLALTSFRSVPSLCNTLRRSTRPWRFLAKDIKKLRLNQRPLISHPICNCDSFGRRVFLFVFVCLFVF